MDASRGPLFSTKLVHWLMSHTSCGGLTSALKGLKGLYLNLHQSSPILFCWTCLSNWSYLIWVWSVVQICEGGSWGITSDVGRLLSNGEHSKIWVLHVRLLFPTLGWTWSCESCVPLNLCRFFSEASDFWCQMLSGLWILLRNQKRIQAWGCLPRLWFISPLRLFCPFQSVVCVLEPKPWPAGQQH